MIRPLIYCETSLHVEQSLATIDSRIAELHALRELYAAKYNELQDSGLTTTETAENKQTAKIQDPLKADLQGVI